MFLFAWIPFIFVVTGMQTGAVTEVIDTYLGGWVTLMVLFFGLSFVSLILGSFILPFLLDGYLDYKGVVAFGRILRASDTGTRINERPVLNLDIKVEPVGSPEFVAEARKTVDIMQVHQYTAGVGATVKYIPGKRHAKILELGTDKDELQSRLIAQGGQGISKIPGLISLLVNVALVIIVPVVIIGFLGFIFLLAPKFTEVYGCTSEQVKTNRKAIEILGEPIELGIYAFGNYESDGITKVYFSTPISGSKGSGTLDVDSVKSSAYYTVRMRIRTDDSETEIYNGEYPCKRD